MEGSETLRGSRGTLEGRSRSRSGGGIRSGYSRKQDRPPPVCPGPWPDDPLGSGVAWPEPVALPNDLHVRDRSGGIGKRRRRADARGGFGAHGRINWSWWVRCGGRTWGGKFIWRILQEDLLGLFDAGLRRVFFRTWFTTAGVDRDSGRLRRSRPATKIDVFGLRNHLSAVSLPGRLRGSGGWTHRSK